MRDETLGTLHSNQRFLVQELQERGIAVDLLVKELELIEARYKDHVELILDRDGSIMPYASAVACGDKYLTKKLLQRAGVSVPTGEQFYGNQKEDALSFAARAGFPVVLKPSNGSHGEGCFFDLRDRSELSGAIDQFLAVHGPREAFLIEQQFEGEEYRILITNRGKFAVVHRDPAHVWGDGKNSIAELAATESRRRRSPRRNCLCPILIDEAVARHLKLQGLSLRSIPAAGQKIYLRRSSNVAQGGTCEDFTEKVHPSVLCLAKMALAAVPGLPYAGVDLMSKSVTEPQTEKSYCILELNSNPGLHLHTRPGAGVGRNVAAFIVDLLFPETVTEIA